MDKNILWYKVYIYLKKLYIEAPLNQTNEAETKQ
jgi:hypothetical protein